MSLISHAVFLAPTLSKDRFRYILEKTSNLVQLYDKFSVPDDKRNDTITAVDFCYQSWGKVIRRMIYYLDEIGDTDLADSLMDNAEAHEGMHVQHLLCVKKSH